MTYPHIGRGAQQDIEQLPPGADLRHPMYRREVFIRFYQFHLENRAHPGCVYYALPWLVARHKLDREQSLWLAFINGNTQHIVSTWMIFREFPRPPLALTPLRTWFETNYDKLAFDTDRRYHKKYFVDAAGSYANAVGDNQADYLRHHEAAGGFAFLWDCIRAAFVSFGRLSTFSYMEYLRIVGGIDADCDDLFLGDMQGSKSHRNGLAIVLGRDDLDWRRETAFQGNYGPELLTWLGTEAALLLAECQQRFAACPLVPPRDVSYFTLESAFCTYKSWHRKNRRYPNVYNDMFRDRIVNAGRHWSMEDLAQFWEMRRDCVPEHLRVENNPRDPGLCPEKQNYYRLTGRPIMMSKRWLTFANAFDERVWG